jgi:hypothetical protein
MRCIIALLLTSLFLTGCGTVTSSNDVPRLTQAAAVALGARYYNRCNEANELGQCALLYPYLSLDEKNIDPTLLPYVKMSSVANDPIGSLEQRETKVLVLTPAGAKYAVDTFARGEHGGVATSAGEAAERVSWRVATVYVEPSRFVLNGDRATLSGTLQLRHTPLYPVLRSQNLASAEKLDSNQNRRVTLHYKYDFNSMGVLLWQVNE